MSLGSCGTLDAAAKLAFWQSQLPVDYIDNTIVINTWETVDADLSDGVPAKLWAIVVEQTNNGVAVETLEFEITIAHPITGVMTAYTATLAGIASGVQRYVVQTGSLTGGDFAFAHTPSTMTVNSFLTLNHSVPFTPSSVGLIRVRQTTAVDVTSASIEVNIVWDKLVTV